DALRVITLLDRGAQEAAGLKADPVMQADMYETLGTLYKNLGRLDRADTFLTSALDLRRKYLAAGYPDIVNSLDELTLLRLAQGKLSEAESLAKEGMNLARTHQGMTATLGRALVTLGRVQAEQGHYAEAIRTLDEAVALNSKRSAASLDLSASLRALAAAQYS